MSNIHEKRLSRIKEMLEANPNSTFLLFAAAKEYDATGNPAKAIELYEKLTSINEDYIGAYYHHAELLNRQDQPTRANEIIEAGVRVARKLEDQKNLAELLQLAESF